MKNSKKGFTLIELLVVVAVIGILASVILIGLAGFRGRGRDARRLTDLSQLQTGLELFFNTCSKYPTVITGLISPGANPNCIGGPPSIGITRIPTDPSTGANYAYGINGAANRYTLGATLEESNSALKDDIDGPSNDVACGSAGPTDTIYCTTI